MKHLILTFMCIIRDELNLQDPTIKHYHLYCRREGILALPSSVFSRKTNAAGHFHDETLTSIVPKTYYGSQICLIVNMTDEKPKRTLRPTHL